MTPVEENSLVEHWRERENRRHFGTAQLSAIVVNMFAGKGGRTYDAADFLPFRPPPRYLTVDEADAMMAKAFQIDEGKI